MGCSSVVFLTGALAAMASAQTLEIYSEFQRVDPFGSILPADRAPRPREILSPAVARNGFASFHVVVSVPRGTSYFLYAVPNPVNACRVALYKERFVRTKSGWVPDTLVALRRLPDFGAMPDPDQDIPGQNTRVYLLDLWIPPDTNLHAFRFEVQLKVGYWIVKPMEVRIAGARIPDPDPRRPAGRPEKLPHIEQGADAAAAGPLQEYVSLGIVRRATQPLTVRGIIRRNAIQDMALARSLDPSRTGPEAIGKHWKTLSGEGAPKTPSSLGAEWYLRIRDLVYAESKARSAIPSIPLPRPADERGSR